MLLAIDCTCASRASGWSRAAGPPAVRSRWLAASQLLIFATFHLVDSRIDEPYLSYLLFNALLLGHLVFALGVLKSRSRP